MTKRYSGQKATPEELEKLENQKPIIDRLEQILTNVVLPEGKSFYSIGGQKVFSVMDSTDLIAYISNGILKQVILSPTVSSEEIQSLVDIVVKEG